MLELLDDGLEHCRDCDLYNNGDGGKCPPYWTIHSRYAIIGEAPGRDEVQNREPFIGQAGKHLWDTMDKFGLKKNQFLIINSVSCRPVNDGKNGKPTKHQQEQCRGFVRKYLKVVRPEKILILGNHAMYTITGRDSGIMMFNSETMYNEEFQANQVVSVHPSMCMYKGDEGKEMLKESIEVFKNL